jgi:hypothetical protein
MACIKRIAGAEAVQSLSGMPGATKKAPIVMI